MPAAPVPTVDRGSRLLRTAVVLVVAAASPLDAQDPPRTTYAAANPLFLVTRDEPLACSAVPPQDWHADQGIARQYAFQLPNTRRSGQVGSAANGSVRYLLVSLEVSGSQGLERYAASLRFSAAGRVEVGRQSREFTELQTNQTQSQTGGLRDDEAVAALGFARELLARCRR